MDIYFLIPGDINSLTGGHLYNKRMIEGLGQKGHGVHILRLEESIHKANEIESKSSLYFNELPGGACVIIDSLVFGILHDVLKEYGRKLTFIGLIHLPLTFNPLFGKTGKNISYHEVEAMKQARHLIVTGRFTFHLLIKAGISGEMISLIEPGVENYPRKQHYPAFPVHLLCISNYSEIKDQLLLVQALNKLRNNNWVLQMYGNLNGEKAYVARLKSFIVKHRLHDRIKLHDSIDRNSISRAFLESDLFVLPSRFETYGMVLTEALGHGIPVITTYAGSIPDTVPPAMGRFTQAGNLDSLVSALELLFTDSQKYKSICIAASGYYRQAKSWPTSVDKLERLIKDIQEKNPK